MGLLPERKAFLEIGCFEGRATCWFLEHALDYDGLMVCIDPFKGSMEHSNMNLSHLFEQFKANVDEAKKPTQSLRTMTYESYRALAVLIEERQKFDLIYVDGDHTAPAVLTDACMSWPMLKKGGIMVFDDYLWNPAGYTDRLKPKLAIDVFGHVFGDQFHVVHEGHQIAALKL
jgi:predicted O-methyltransferase YrrM